MILTCPACQTRYQADASRFPPEGRSVRCAKCGEVWHQSAPEPEPEPEPFVAPSAPPPPPPSYPPEEPQPQFYAQPPVRDVEPQSGEEMPEEPAAPRRRSAWPRRLALGAGWAALAAVVLMIGFAATVYRQQIVQVWPQSASLYSKLGVKVSATGLDIHNIKYTEAPQGGQLVLTVTGALTNVSNREQPVPQIRVALVGDDQRELYHWTFAPEVMTLRPGQSTQFVTRLSNPPEGAKNFVVRFAKAGE